MRPYHWLLAPFFWWFSSDPDSFSTRNGPQMRIPISPRMQLLGNRKRSCLDLKGPAAQSRIGTHPICNRKSTQQEIMYSTESTEHVKILNSVSFFFFKGLDDVPSPKFFLFRAATGLPSQRAWGHRRRWATEKSGFPEIMVQKAMVSWGSPHFKKPPYA